MCLLKKSLYGLKQSPRHWYKKFDSFTLSQGFKRSSYNICEYFKHMPGNISIYLLLYVDDMLIASQSAIEIENLKLRLRSVFEMKELREVKKILGIEIRRNRQQRQLFLSQKSYLSKLVRRLICVMQNYQYKLNIAIY